MLYKVDGFWRWFKSNLGIYCLNTALESSMVKKENLLLFPKTWPEKHQSRNGSVRNKFGGKG